MRRKGATTSRRGVSDPFNVTEEAVTQQVNENTDPFSYKEPESEKTPEELAAEAVTDPKDKPTEEKEEPKIEEPVDPFSYKGVEEVVEGVVVDPKTGQLITATEEKKDLNDEETEINPYFYLGNVLKKDGFFEADVTEETTSSDIVSSFKKSVQEEAMRQIQQEAQQKLIAQGYDLEDLKFAKLLRSGTDESLLRGVAKYDNLSSIKLETADESDKKRLATEYYKDRGWKEKEIEDQVERVVLDEELEDIAKISVKHFKDKRDKIVKDQEDAADNARLAREQASAKQSQRVEDILKSGKLLEDEIYNSNEFRRSVYQKDFIAEIGGKEYPITELQNFLLSFDNDPETKLWAFSKWKYRNEEKEEIKEQAKKEAEEDLLEDYKKIVTKSKAKTTTRKVKQALKVENPRDWVSPTGNRGPIIVGK